MYCQYCGSEVKDDQEICLHCGRRLRPESFTKKMYKHDWTRLTPVDTRKSPGGAAALGFFLGWVFLGPLGYVYLGQWNWFWITFVIEIVAYPFTLFFAYFIFPIVFAIHQYQMAKDLNVMFDKNMADVVAGTGDDTGSGTGEGRILP